VLKNCEQRHAGNALRGVLDTVDIACVSNPDYADNFSAWQSLSLIEMSFDQVWKLSKLL
jgi:hypothetical protein